jgi:hyaluronan synthase
MDPSLIPSADAFPLFTLAGHWWIAVAVLSPIVLLGLLTLSVRSSLPGTVNHPFGGLVILGVVGTTLVWVTLSWGSFSVYGAVLLAMFALKIALSWMSRDRRTLLAEEQGRLDAMNVGTAIPVYNEDPALLADCLHSILGQRRLPRSVVVVDDGSTDTTGIEIAESLRDRFEDAGVAFRTHRLERNMGKRQALVAAFDLQPDADTFLCIDSDTVLQADAVENLLPAFLDDHIHAATGLVLPLNDSANLLTRLTDVRYANAFLFERAAYSTLDSVLCCCGSLAIYRAALVRTHRHDFLAQTFLGKPAVFGDDRRMTNYALLEGGVRLQSRAVAYTAVPEKMGHFVRQQIRWSKSFFRESVWAIRHLPANRPGKWLSLLELTSWLALTIALVGSLLVLPITTGVFILAEVLTFMILLSYARSARYLEVAGPRRSNTDAIGGFLIAPLYGLLHLGCLLWLRAYALVTLNKGAWGTRAQVEVFVRDDAVAAPAPSRSSSRRS